MMTNKQSWLVATALLSVGVSVGVSVAQADVAIERPTSPTVRPTVPPRPIVPVSPNSRDAVGLARRDPEIAKMIVAARGGQSDQTGPASPNETAVQVSLGGQCGFAGCSSSTLVAFTFRTAGANTMTHSVLALVTCPPIQSQPCVVAPAEIKTTGGSNQK